MNHLRTPLLTALTALALAAPGVASSAVVLSTTFDGRTVSGATASNLGWTTNGVANPGNLTAVAGTTITGMPPAMALFDTAAAANRFAVNRNVQNESPWLVDIALNVLAGHDIQLGNVTLDAFIFNNDGLLQPAERELDLRLALFQGATQLASVLVNDIYVTSNSLPAQPRPVNFSLTGNTLAAGGAYTLRLTASADARIGNNAGIDNLTVNGTLVPQRAIPEPGSLALLGVALAGLALASRRKAR